ncbi:helix-turn-helix domain-containing protein [Leminorella grimontii]|uniref:helix-turn-helix domain-containing protein n=1 Tax=Leminorella grimontii TaxID=82981 RepID=UPI00322081DE
MRIDNPEHKALFSIPAASYSTELATTKPLPPQKTITGHKQTDAYLWVLEVIRTNEPAHLPAAEEALKKLKITPKEAQKRYSDYLMASGAHPLQIAFGTMNIDDPEGYLRGARRNIERASLVRSYFGSYSAALENTPPEKLMLVGELDDVYSARWGWTKEEIAANCVQGERCQELDKQRKAISKGFTKQLPEPTTLSDVVREFQYWDWLYSMRNSAEKELGYEYADGGRCHVNDREEYLETLLPKIKPVTRQEAINVCKWILEEERFMDRGELTDEIILNLVGECG